MARRAIGTAVVLCLVAAAFGAHAGAAPRPAARTESAPYQPLEGEIGVGQPGPLVSTVTLPGGPENYVTVELTDASGGPVLAEIVQQDVITVFCGATDGPVRIEPSFDVTVRIHEGRCFGGGPAVATHGTVEATFERLPLKSTESKAYSAPANDTVGWDDDPELIVRSEDVYFLPAGRKYVSVEIEDASGTVGAKVLQEEERSRLFCGRTDEPLRINPKLPFRVLLFDGRCGDAPSVVTEGAVTVEFLKRP
ncbi:MAG TPA: hypothetical protein VHN37_10215 [Actinomycetota bacterium]|nr:hypothetical protein [Actinomycetota bacterium]